MSLCVSDINRLNCGDYLRQKEGRHIGRVEAVLHSSIIKLKWESGFIEYYPLSDYHDGELVKVKL